MLSCKGGPGSTDPGLFTCTNYNLSNLVSMAFQLMPYQLPSADYGDRAMYEISAKVPPGATREQFNVMLRNLVIERFKLTYHYEKKEMQVYDLTVVKGALKMKESPTEDPAANGAESSDAEPPRPAKTTLDADGYPKVPTPKHGSNMSMMATGRTRWTATGIAMEGVVAMLAAQMGGPVVDSTGLHGNFDFELTWVAGNDMSADASGPTLAQAVQQQLGLKLQRKKGEVNVFVIDHVDKTPAEN